MAVTVVCVQGPASRLLVGRACGTALAGAGADVRLPSVLCGAGLVEVLCRFDGGLWLAGTGWWWSSISGRNPSSGLCRSWRRRRLWASRSFLEASSMYGAPPLTPRPWLRRETSDLRDRAMKASSRLLPPWGHRLGAGYNLRPVDGGIFAAWKGDIFAAWDGGIFAAWKGDIFAAWFAEAAVSGAPISVWQR